MTNPKPAAGSLLRFGAEVRTRRTNLNLTRSEIAARSKLSQSYIGKLERGATNPTLDTMASVAEALGVEVHDLLDDR